MTEHSVKVRPFLYPFTIVKCNLIHTSCVEVFYVCICPIFSWFSRTNAIPVVFKACNLRPVFEKAKFDVAGKVIFRRIWNTVSRSKNTIFHRSALSHFPFKLLYSQSYKIFHNLKCKMTLFEDHSILESALRLKVSSSLVVLPC